MFGDSFEGEVVVMWQYPGASAGGICPERKGGCCLIHNIEFIGIME